MRLEYKKGNIDQSNVGHRKGLHFLFYYYNQLHNIVFVKKNTLNDKGKRHNLGTKKMSSDSQDIRRSILAKWHESLSK